MFKDANDVFALPLFLEFISNAGVDVVVQLR